MGTDVNYIAVANKSDFESATEKIKQIVDKNDDVPNLRHVLLSDGETVVFEVWSFVRWVDVDVEEGDDDRFKDNESRVESLIEEVEKLIEVENVKLYYTSETDEVFFGVELFNKDKESAERILEKLDEDYYVVDSSFLNILEKLPTVFDC